MRKSAYVDESLRIDKADITEGDWLFSMQLQGEKLREIVQKLHDKDKQIANEFTIEKERLYKCHNGKKLYSKSVQSAHDNSGHLSVDRTIEKL